MVRLLHPGVDTFGPSMIVKCREELAEGGKTDFPPLVIVNDIPTDDESTLIDGVVIVPASQFAAYLGLQITWDGTTTATITSAKVGGKRLTTTVGRKNAQGSTGDLVLPVPPQQGANEILIPVRAVAEYFGCSVTWKPVPKMVWVD